MYCLFDGLLALQWSDSSDGSLQIQCCWGLGRINGPRKVSIPILLGRSEIYFENLFSYAVAKLNWPGCLRAIFADPQNQYKNAVHGSAHEKVAKHEIHFFFPNSKY